MTVLEDFPNAKRYFKHYKIHRDYYNAGALLVMAIKQGIFVGTLLPDFVKFYDNY